MVRSGAPHCSYQRQMQPDSKVLHPRRKGPELEPGSSRLLFSAFDLHSSLIGFTSANSHYYV